MGFSPDIIVGDERLPRLKTALAPCPAQEHLRVETGGRGAARRRSFPAVPFNGSLICLCGSS
jgi:hypothetical protein